MAEPILKGEFVQKPHAYMTLAEIRRSAPPVSEGVGSGLPPSEYAFTLPGFQFPSDYIRDWKIVSQPPIVQWRFEGLVLILRVCPVVTLPSDFRKWPDILAVITRHEQLHVQDAREIVMGPLPKQLKSDATFKGYFIDRTPVPEATYRHMFPGRMEEYVGAMFAELWNKKVAERDSPASLRPFRDAVDALIRKRHR